MAGAEAVPSLIERAAQLTERIGSALEAQELSGGTEIAGLASEGVQAAGVLRDWFDPSAGIQVQSHTFVVMSATAGEEERPEAAATQPGPGQRGRGTGRDSTQLRPTSGGGTGESIPLSVDPPVVRTERESLRAREAQQKAREQLANKPAFRKNVLTCRSKESAAPGEVTFGLRALSVPPRFVCVAGVLSLRSRAFDSLIGSQAAVQFDGVDVETERGTSHALSLSGWFKRAGFGFFIRFTGLVLVHPSDGGLELQQGGMSVTGATQNVFVGFGDGYILDV